MNKPQSKASGLRRLPGDKGGNFGITTAIVIPVLLGIVGLAIDYTNMSQQKNRLQDAADSGALAAASALAEKGITEQAARDLALSFLRGQIRNSGITADQPATGPDGNPDGPFTAAPVVEITQIPVNGSGKSYTVAVKATYEVPLSGFLSVLGIEHAEVSVASKSTSQTESRNALSMFLVLDRSGSMAWKTDTRDTTKTACPNYTEGNWNKYPNLAASSPCYIPKVAALKTAVSSLMAQLKIADPDGKYVRTGAISYDLATQSPTPLAWGTTAAMSYVNALVANGGTSSSAGVQNAYDQLTKASEDAAHKQKNGQVPSKYIVFMTDGDNNYTADDTTTKATCAKARKASIQVYTVAFMAPSRGQALLLDCAGDSAHYFKADDMQQLVAAFKAIGEKASQLSTRLTN